MATHDFGATLAGTTHPDNEDLWGTSGTLTWVIDGASQPETTVGTWTALDLVRALNNQLVAFGDRDDLTLTEITRQAIRGLLEDRPDDEHGPAATLALTRRNGDTVEWLLLGDAGILLPLEDGVTYFADVRGRTIAVDERRAYLAARATASDNLPEAWEALYAAEQEERNTPGGYWVVADTETAADHAIAGVATVTGDVVLGTDGFFDGLGTHWATPAAAHSDVTTRQAPGRVLDQLHATLLTATTAIDDATFAVCRA